MTNSEGNGTFKKTKINIGKRRLTCMMFTGEQIQQQQK